MNSYIVTLSNGSTVKCMGEVYNVGKTALAVLGTSGNVIQQWANGTWTDIAIVNLNDPTQTAAAEAYQPVVGLSGGSGTGLASVINWTGTGPIT